MVRSLKACLLACILAIAFAMPLHAASYPYQGTVSETYVKIFEDVVADVSILDNYVFYRSGENQYSMVVGDIKEEDGYFTVESGDMYTVDYVSVEGTSWNQQGYYSYKHYLDVSWEFDSEDMLVYSDLKGYPKLEERGVTYAFCTVFVFIVFICSLVLWRIFKFVLRKGTDQSRT